MPIKIEVLYPDLCNLFGDIQNSRYLELSLPEAEFVKTDINDVPHFAQNDVDMIILSSMTEGTQLKVVERLKPYKERISQLIDRGVVFLFTGNAYEVMLKEIRNKTKNTVDEGLGIFNLYSEIDMYKRYNGKTLAEFEDIEIVGFRAQFSMVYPGSPDKAGDEKFNDFFLKCTRGIGINSKGNSGEASGLEENSGSGQTAWEGVHYKNFFGTSLLGPILLLNPLFAKKIMELLGEKEKLPAFYDVALQAYHARLEEFKLPQIDFNS